MSDVLQINDLSKNYRSVKAVSGLNINIPKGSVYGMLGPNGSGKTTTLACVLGAIIPGSGNFTWFEGQYGSNYHLHIGALLEQPVFYPYLNAIDNLKISALIKKVPVKSIDPILERVGLSNAKSRSFRTYSLGMKQRLAIASALLPDPEVLILDEPTNGLDPQGIAEIRALINGLANEGKTILLASHLLDEVQKVCTHVAVMKQGKLLFQGRVNELGSTGSAIELSSDDTNRLEMVLRSYPVITSIDKQGEILLVQGSIDPAELNKYLFDNGVILSRLNIRQENLEQQFLQLLS